MTHTKKIIVLDNSSGNVIILPVEYNPADDMEVAVFKAYNLYNDSNDLSIYLKDSQCSWMELADDYKIIDAYCD